MKHLKLLDYILELIAITCLILMFYIVYITYPILPDYIPTHWNYKEIPDDYGYKYNYFSEPLLALFIYIIFTLAVYFTIKKKDLNLRTKDFLVFVRLLRLMKIFSVGMIVNMIYRNSLEFLKIKPVFGHINTFVTVIPIIVLVGVIIFKGNKLK